MADSPVSPQKAQEPATTREEMDFDNSDHEQETGKVSPLGAETEAKFPSSTKSPSPKPRVSFQDGPAEEIPPSKPPRPLSPQVQAENTLIEAFPSIDTKVVKAVLQASGGQVEPAFNALLGMSDPSFQAEEAPPPRPPRPSAMKQTPSQQRQQPLTQLESDELYARQLAEQYNSTGGRGGQMYNQREPGRRGPNQQRPKYDEEDREHSFFDDDLPEIGKNIQQGFFETQKKVNGWIMNFKKKLDGDEEEEDLYSGSGSGGQGSKVGNMTGGTGTWGGRQNFGSSQSEQLHGIRKSAEQQRRVEERRSMDAQRYDGDPHMIDDSEFQRLELRDDEQPPPQPPRSSSKKANPDLFKSMPRPPQSGPVDEVDAAERKASGGGGSAQQKKWQPLTSVAPNPEEDNDPFAVGDDDDDKEDKTEDQRKEDSDRLKEKARQSISEGASDGKVLAEAEKSGSIGTKNKEAEELLSGKKE